MFSFMTTGEIRREEGCLTINQYAQHKVVITKCINLAKINRKDRRKYRNKQKFQVWTHTKGGQIVNQVSGMCLTAEGLASSDALRAVECSDNDLFQLWWFQKYTDINVQVDFGSHSK